MLDKQWQGELMIIHVTVIKRNRDLRPIAARHDAVAYQLGQRHDLTVF